MNIADYIEQAIEQLEAADLCYGHGTDNAHDEAYYLVYGVLRVNVFDDLTLVDRPLSSGEVKQLDAALRARIGKRIPVAYLVGKSWFAGTAFYSDARALVPRSPLAETIENEFQPMLPKAPERVLDLCTGSGCIGIATGLAFPDCRVDLADIDGDCLALAQRNIDLHGVGDRVKTCQSDLFEQIDGRYDLIITNPPYVSAEVHADLPPEFLHEPILGLVSSDAGLDLPLRILRQASQHLTTSGWLFMEVGYQQEALQARVGDLPLLWLEYEYGGGGVCAIQAEALLAVQDSA